MAPQKFQRRKSERPQEIVEAALATFAEKGYASAGLDEIAERAGVSKGTLYLYFATKEALFEAVVETCTAGVIDQLVSTVKRPGEDFAAFLPRLLETAVTVVGSSRVPAVAKLVVGESGNFPAMARVWQRKVVVPFSSALTARIRAAQRDGELTPGPPEIHYLSIVAPVVIAMLAREVFGTTMVTGETLQALAKMHARTILDGMLRKPDRPLQVQRPRSSRTSTSKRTGPRAV